MSHLPFVKRVDNNDGFVLVTALIVMVVLILFGTFALNTTNVEIQIADNDHVAKEDFSNQEGCVANGKFQFRTWLTNAYIETSNNDASTAFFPQPGADINGNSILDTDESQCWFPPKPPLPPPAKQPVLVGSYMVRNIENTGTAITGWSDMAKYGGIAANHPANNFPAMDHIDKPDVVSENQLDKADGQSSVVYRKYLVTSYSQQGDRHSIVQQGVFRVFPKVD